LSLICDKDTECLIKVSHRFNYPKTYAKPKKAKKDPKSPTSASKAVGDDDDQVDTMQTMEANDEDELAPTSPMMKELGMSPDNFSLGEGPLNEKKQKLQKFVEKLVEDDNVRHRFNNKISRIKEKQ